MKSLIKPQHRGRLVLSDINEELVPLWDAAKPFYDLNKKHRYYHNEEHANYVVDSLLKIHDYPTPALILAARWHDAIYTPGSIYNELASADAFFNQVTTLTPGMRYRPLAHEVAELIRGTCIQVHLRRTALSSHEQLGFLLDADLSGLAETGRVFSKRQLDIIKENVQPSLHHDAPTMKKAKETSKQFLYDLALRRKKIFHTHRGRKLWEDIARENIEIYYNKKD